MSKWSKRNLLIIGMMCAFSLCFLCILPLGHDLWFHLYRIGAMAAELQEGSGLPIRMLSDSFRGYGYGAALYYGDFFLYFPALLAAMGMSVVTAYRIFMVCIWWMTFLVACGSMRLLKSNGQHDLWAALMSEKDSCMLFACFYTFSSCCLWNLCIRSAVGEALAFAFLPLVFAAAYRILRKEDRENAWLWLGLGMAAIALSHTITLFLTCVVLFFWMLGELLCSHGTRGGIFQFLKAAAIALGLSASFLLPMLEQMLYQRVQTPGNDDFQKREFRNHSLELIDYFLPYEIKKVLVSWFSFSWNIESWHPGPVGLFALVLIVCYLAGKPKVSPWVKKAGVFSVIALILPGIRPLVALAGNGFAFLQFPWRVLSLITVGVTVLGTAMAEDFLRRHRRKYVTAMVGAAFAIAVFTIGARYGYQVYVQRDDFAYVRENNPDYYHKYLYRYDPNAADALYLPEGVWAGLYQERGETVTSNYAELSFRWIRQGGEIVITLEHNPYEDAYLELPLYMYKGYAAKTEEGHPLKVVKSENGLVQVLLEPSEETTVRVGYDTTVCQKVSDLVTLLTVLWLIFLYFYSSGRKLWDFKLRKS